MRKPTPRLCPDVSVVISTYQRPHQLARTLEALARQDYTGAFEVIVVNDGGSPLEDVQAQFEQFRFLYQANAGPGAGRNFGVEHARGPLIAFTDDDCEPRLNWLSALKRAAEENPDCMLGGYTVNALKSMICSAASQGIQDIVYGFYNSDPLNARFFASNNMAIPAALFRSLGGFDRSFRTASEDRDLCERWRSSGARMVYVSDAIVEHSHRLTFAGFVRQHFGYGRGAARFHRKRMRTESSSLGDHTSLYGQWRDWLFRPWRESRGFRALHLQFLLVTWHAANVAGFAWGWVRDVPD